MSTASILSRIEDTLMRYLRKLTPFTRKLMLLYTSGQQFEQTERGFVRTILRFAGNIYGFSQRAERGFVRTIPGVAGRIYGFSEVLERRALEFFRTLAKKVLALQASLEDAVSFSSLYMNLLFVVAVLLMVVVAWSFKP